MTKVSNKIDASKNSARLKNIRHEHFCREYVTNSGNGTRAYLEAYPSAQYNSANVNSSQLLTKPNIKNRVTELLEAKTGSQLSVLLTDLTDFKKANKTIVVDKIMAEVQDNPTRLEAVKTLLKLHGLLAPSSQTVDARSVTFNITPPDIKSLANIVNRLEAVESRQDRISGKV